MFGFAQIWVVDFEYGTSPIDGRPIPRCLVTREYTSGRTLRVWENELLALKAPPYPIGEDVLFVAFNTRAELSCHLALGWDFPACVLDPFVEFYRAVNGIWHNPFGKGKGSKGLIAALQYFGLPHFGAVEKKEMQDLAIRGGPWSPGEPTALMDYCETDVTALTLLLHKMVELNLIDLPRALLRARYMSALTRIERTGTPINAAAYQAIIANWEAIKNGLIEEIDKDYHVFEDGSFKESRWERWVAQHNLAWPRLATGRLELGKKVFRDMARSHKAVAPIHELRATLGQLKGDKPGLLINADGRNRVGFFPFSTRSSRNAPSSTEFIFALPSWMRGLVAPRPGYGLAMIDWEQQEFGIGAALSGDEKMIVAYESGDPYMQLAIQANAAPAGATKASHRAIREQFKAVTLGLQYGMRQWSLAGRIQQPVYAATGLINAHRRVYSKFWKWSEANVDYAMTTKALHTVFGWEIHLDGPDANPRSLSNFPLQANGAEMMRLGCIFAVERGVTVCCPNHDAILIEAPLCCLNEAVAVTVKAMSDASAEVLDGFRLRTEPKIIRYPNHYTDERGEQMWNLVWKAINAKSVPQHQCHQDPCQNVTDPCHFDTGPVPR